MPKKINTTNKYPLPEISTENADLVNAAKEAIQHRAQAARHTKQEKDHRKSMEEGALELHNEEFGKGNIVGLIRIIDSEIPPTRVEMRINNGALDMSEEETLTEHFGARKAELFEHAKVITEITDTSELIKALENKGLNPWEYVNVTIKNGMDEAVLSAVGDEHVVSAEAFLPRQGFLSKLNDMFSVLGDKAKQYVKEYLSSVLKPTVVLGTAATKKNPSQ